MCWTTRGVPTRVPSSDTDAAAGIRQVQLFCRHRGMPSRRLCIWWSPTANTAANAFSGRCVRRLLACWCGCDAGITCRTSCLVGSATGCGHSACTVLRQHGSRVASRTRSSSCLGRRVMRVSRNPDLLAQREHDMLLIGSATKLHRRHSRNVHPPTDFYRALLHDLPGKVFEQRSSGELYVGRPPRSYHMLLKEELMFAKHMLFSILTAVS